MKAQRVLEFSLLASPVSPGLAHLRLATRSLRFCVPAPNHPANRAQLHPPPRLHPRRRCACLGYSISRASLALTTLGFQQAS